MDRTKKKWLLLRVPPMSDSLKMHYATQRNPCLAHTEALLVPGSSEAYVGYWIWVVCGRLFASGFHWHTHLDRTSKKELARINKDAMVEARLALLRHVDEVMGPRVPGNVALVRDGGDLPRPPKDS